MTGSTQIEFSRPLEVSAIGRHGLERSIAANGTEREALARRFALLGLERLVASLRLRRLDDGTLELAGRLEAKVVQACVVTLEPVMADIDIGFTRLFNEKPEATAREVTLDPEHDEPEPIENGRIDLGEVVAEELALALDPYPRAPGAALPAALSDGGSQANGGDE